MSLLILLVIALSFTTILGCKSFLPSDVKIVAEPYQWNNDMIRLRITTPEKGLIFKITISNNGTSLISIDKIYINVKVECTGRIWSFLKQLEIDYLELPPKESHYRFVNVDFGGGDPIGSYSAKLTYSEYGFDSNPIEPYPFNFDVVSQDEFQRRVQQNPPPSWSFITIIIENLHIEIIGGATITILAIGGWTWRKRKQKKSSEKTSPNKEDTQKHTKEKTTRA